MPPRGPAVPLTLTYQQRDATQPQIFTAANVGPRWSLGWARFVEEIPQDTLGVREERVRVAQPAGGSEYYTDDNAQGVFPAHWASRAVLVRVSTAPLRYERRLPDGTVEIYGWPDGAPAGRQRVFLTALVDPLGQRLQFTWDAQLRLVALADAAGQVTTIGYGLAGDPLKVTSMTDPYGRTATLLDRYNTLYWDRRAWVAGPNQLATAEITHWLIRKDYRGDAEWITVPHSVKRPLESRVWYAYPGQSSPHKLGWWRQPSRVGRVLEDGTSQITETTYNTQGSPLTRTDPLGRQTSYSYAADGVTLTGVRQTTGGLNDLLASYGDFTALDLPQTATDAAGQTTAMTYNAAGQVLTVTNARAETTSYSYDPDGRLTTVAGPVVGATTSYTYDAYGRVRTVTDGDGATVTTDYDVFDRPVRTTYPDGTYEETTYDRLDVSTRRDRAGRMTRFYYDALRRLTATRDPAGRVVGQTWGRDGLLEALIDANGNRTSWERDLQGRVTREVRADGVTDTLYTYGPRSGRLLTVTDPKRKVTTYTYAADDQRLSMAWTNALVPTPAVSFTYDAAYGRLASMSDGTGVTTYAYHAPGLHGAGQVAAVDGPLPNDTITYTYDALGRVESRAIDGTANLVTWSFDALGRVSSESTLLGTFTYGYDGPTSRLASVIYPNGQSSAYSYFGVEDDRRLQTIHHKYPNGQTLSKFDYTYDAVGNIVSWRQQADQDAVLWEYGYDAADQLVAAVKKAVDPQQTVLTRYAYAYDPAGNRTAEQIDDQVTGASYDRLNRLLSQQPSGPLVVAGTVSEPATVTIQGAAVPVDASNRFSGRADITGGTNLLALTATDASGNSASAQYEIDSAGTARTFTYDANGNMTSDGTRTFEWDARNQLSATASGISRTEFAYNGHRQRVAILTRTGDLTASTTLVWCGLRLCEERDIEGETVLLRSYGLGETRNAGHVFYTNDHLGSVSAVTDQNAAWTGRYTYDPWGRRTVTELGATHSVGFTSHQWQATAGLWLTLYRAYDPETAVWLSQDPIGLSGGLNLYAYAAGAPVRYLDPLGLKVTCRSSVGYQNEAQETKCKGNPEGCTWGSMSSPQAKPCRQECGEWSFEGSVNLEILVQFRVNHNDRSRDTPGATLQQHEALHVGDLLQWCSSLNSRYPSEGFKGKPACDRARTKFLFGVGNSFMEAQNESHRNHDK